MAVDMKGQATGQARSGIGAILTLQHAMAVLRLAFGWIFLWSFADRLLGLGFATEVGWIDGGSPTQGFLIASSHGVLEDIYVRLAGVWLVDALFMAGIGGIGLALLSGIGVRIAAVSGAAIHALIWSVYLPPVSNPFIDEHIVQAIALLALALANAGDTWGLGRWWSGVPLVRKYPVLK